MGRYRSRSYSPRRSKRYDDPRDSRSRRDRRSPAPSGLLVRNISLDVRPEDLRIPFERFGPIKDVYLPKDYYTGEPKGFGFVKFQYPKDAADAKEHLNYTVIGGREIRIVFAEENRKTPQEMRRSSHISVRGSYQRRSPARSPRRLYHSYSRSPSPARSDLRYMGPPLTWLGHVIARSLCDILDAMSPLSGKGQISIACMLREGLSDAGQGMTITLHADPDLFPDLCRHVMGEVIGRNGTRQGVLDPFPGLFLRVMRGITGQTAGPQARERMVEVPLTRGIVNRAGHQIQGENLGVP
ncbi:SC35-like splicing factor 28 [Actinidia rufa]|uniref:SC35-like splicing factor 28 n=1 Tax=Actinidia rufa TaxID=165716 RepID=A0A7J0HFW9_9ERIC|nr:SC35-like splicing factor 28 [Actinidia rufa]